MDLRQGILSTAGALGVNPVDLATAISYETAGTFDATKRGPTTQWGQHRGLIQFGEPQARKYGVNWDDPLGSQLGPNGAVANYLRDTGVKPGMGLLDIYSAINAGGVGRYNRSDANNGGAPGTVRDKVEQQMAGHRRKAEALMGGQSQPVAVGGPQQDTLEAAPMQNAGPMQQGRQPMFFKNMDPDRRDRLIMALQGMTMNPNQGLMAMAQQNMQSRAKEADRTRAAQAQQQKSNQTAQILRQNGAPDFIVQLAEMGRGSEALSMWQKSQAAPEQTSLQKQYAQAVQQGYQGSLMDYQIELKRAGASSTTINTGDKGPAPDATVRDELQKNHADVLSGFLGAGAKAGSALNDLQVLKELASVAPTGPLQGRLAQAFPEFSDVSALRQAIVKRVAPTLRVEGSGSTSDIEYQGMIDGLGRLTNTPEANIAIADMMLAKANLDIQRGNVVQQYQNGQITYEQMNTQLAEMNKVSIMPESVRAMLSGGAATQPQAQPVQLPQVPNFTEMSDADLDAYIEKMGGQ